MKNTIFFRAFCDYCGLCRKMRYDDFASLYYRLQMMKRYPFLQGRFWDKHALECVENEIRIYIAKSFKKMTSFQFVDNEQHFSYKKKMLTYISFLRE
jgi:hypothetical protein